MKNLDLERIFACGVVCSIVGCAAPDLAHRTYCSTNLIQAVEDHNAVLIEKLLDEGASVDLSDPEDKSALYLAAINDDVIAAYILLDHGANPNRRVAGVGPAPLHAAAYHGSAGVSRLLLQWGADPNLNEKGGVRPIHAACWHGSYEVVKQLISAHADLNVKTDFGSSPLHVESLPSDLPQSEEVFVAIARMMITHGSRITVTDSNGQTPAERAVRLGYKKLSAALAFQ